jgi:peptidoglycan L-alanyl-D-glutamate endopeptidase CwlK
VINSRSLDDLIPPAKQRVLLFIEAAKSKGIDLLVTSTYRDNDSQAALFAQGRTLPGKVVTNARPGESFHNWRCAVDVVPLVNGKAIWDDNALWLKIGIIGESCGLQWAGRWTTFKEMPHFQYTGGLTIAQLNQGATIA